MDDEQEIIITPALPHRPLTEHELHLLGAGIVLFVPMTRDDFAKRYPDASTQSI